MKTNKTILLAALLVTTTPVWAQQAQPEKSTPALPLGKGVTVKQPPPPIRIRLGGLPDHVEVPAGLRERMWVKKVSAALNSASADEALKEILDASGFSYEYDTEFYPTLQDTDEVNRIYGSNVATTMLLDLPARLITMKLVNASVPNALDSVCKALGVGWTATAADETEVPTIHIMRLRDTITRIDLIKRSTSFRGSGAGGGFGGAGGGFGGGGEAAPTEGVGGGVRVNDGGLGGGGFGGGVGGGAVGGKDERVGFLSNSTTRVSVEANDNPARETLDIILKGVQVKYVLDDDVAQAKKITVTLKNVTLRTALDALCESAGLGWTVESAADPGKYVVHIGKQFAPATDK